MARTNCWQFKRCGREPEGAKVAQLGVCPATTETRTTGINGGANGGRACWALAGTLCGGAVQGSFVTKVANCQACDFYKAVRQDEGAAMVQVKAILARVS